jgi:hypothetical protein
MAGQLPIHISIYVKNTEAKGDYDQLKISYEVEDNDECLIFTPIMFSEALDSFAKDHDKIYGVTLDQLRQRFAALQMSAVVPPHIGSKIEGIINYVEKHPDIYVGIGVVYRV